ncbi:MlaD family protein [Rhodococcus artemisiae]|uniref:MlaD family protein n=1 Tax=Rhodococcus artemisiae TaxID=714159 RepID=A0ABU7LAK3_9NOCA|nr:MlaD family protein [Rhodococcus artemisiae]MEE2058555.1 MlaD family protein [Rhodococcus artemisiae]
MPAYGLPGISISQHTARTVGVGLIGVVLLTLVAWRILPEHPDTHTMNITLVADTVGEGVEPGTEVRRHGVTVGSVTSIERADSGQHIRVALNRSDVGDLTDTLTIDYSPANLFGITQLTLFAGHGGTPLADGDQLDLTGGTAERVHDATTSTFLDSLGGLTNDVLTPELADLAATLARESRAFTPMIQAILATAESIEATQRMPYSGILDDLGRTFDRLPSTLHGGLVLLDSVYSEPYLEDPSNREKFDKTVSMLGQQLIPSVAHLLTTLQPHYQGLTGLIVPLLDAVAGAGATTANSGDLRELVDRLDSAFVDGPAGPILRVAVGIGGAPSASGTGSGGTR